MDQSTHTQSSPVRDTIIAEGQRIMSGKGFSAVGLNEILTTAKVPKGSFYHYFASKDAFGVALLEDYFDTYLAEIDALFSQAKLSKADALIRYFKRWRSKQLPDDCHGKCMVVKLGAEVADLSEPMRHALKLGTAGIIARLAGAIEGGVAEGSVGAEAPAAILAETLYQLWLGASVMAKISRDAAPFDAAMSTTKQLLQLPH